MALNTHSHRLGGNTAYKTGLPPATSHKLCEDAKYLRDMLMPLMHKGVEEFFPKPHHLANVEPSGPTHYEVFMREESLPKEQDCREAIERLFTRFRRELGDLSRKVSWRIAPEADIHIRPVYHEDSSGSHIDPISDIRVTVDGVVLAFKTYCRFIEVPDAIHHPSPPLGSPLPEA